MVLLFVGRLMNLLWIAGLALLVLVEKSALSDDLTQRRPAGNHVDRRETPVGKDCCPRASKPTLSPERVLRPSLAA